MSSYFFKMNGSDFGQNTARQVLFLVITCVFLTVAGQANAQEEVWIDEVGIYWLLNGQCHMFYPDSGGAYRLDEAVDFQDEQRIHVQGPVYPFPAGMFHLCGSADLVDVSESVVQLEAQQPEIIDEVGIYWLLNGQCHMFYPDSGGAYRLDEAVDFQDEQRIHVQGPVYPFPAGMFHLCGSADLVDAAQSTIEPVCVNSFDTNCHRCCAFDVTGPGLQLDNLATLGSAQYWWEGDTYACYMVSEDYGELVQYANYFPGCDINADGHITIDDVWTIYNGIGSCDGTCN